MGWLACDWETVSQDTGRIPISRLQQAAVYHIIQYDLKVILKVFSVLWPTTTPGNKTQTALVPRIACCGVHWHIWQHFSLMIKKILNKNQKERKKIRRSCSSLLSIRIKGRFCCALHKILSISLGFHVSFCFVMELIPRTLCILYRFSTIELYTTSLSSLC